MQMGGRRNAHGIDAQRQEPVQIVDGRSVERAGDEPRLLPVRVGDADKLNPRESRKNAGMVAAHDADADDSDAQRVLHAALYALHHVETHPLVCSRPGRKTPSTPWRGWRPTPERAQEQARNQRLKS